MWINYVIYRIDYDVKRFERYSIVDVVFVQYKMFLLTRILMVKSCISKINNKQNKTYYVNLWERLVFERYSTSHYTLGSTDTEANRCGLILTVRRYSSKLPPPR